MLPFFLLFFGWAWLAGMNHTKMLVFPVEGLGTHSPLTLIGIYLASRCFRMEDIENRIDTRWFVALLLFSTPFAFVGMGHYNSPFAFLMAMSLFVIFKRHVRCGKWIMVLSPSMFAVYLLHSTPFGIASMRKMEDLLVEQGTPIYIVFFVVSVVVFLVSLSIDMLRRVIICKSVCR